MLFVPCTTARWKRMVLEVKPSDWTVICFCCTIGCLWGRAMEASRWCHYTAPPSQRSDGRVWVFVPSFQQCFKLCCKWSIRCVVVCHEIIHCTRSLTHLPETLLYTFLLSSRSFFFRDQIRGGVSLTRCSTNGFFGNHQHPSNVHRALRTLIPHHSVIGETNGSDRCRLFSSDKLSAQSGQAVLPLLASLLLPRYGQRLWPLQDGEQVWWRTRLISLFRLPSRSMFC